MLGPVTILNTGDSVLSQFNFIGATSGTNLITQNALAGDALITNTDSTMGQSGTSNTIRQTAVLGNTTISNTEGALIGQIGLRGEVFTPSNLNLIGQTAAVGSATITNDASVIQQSGNFNEINQSAVLGTATLTNSGGSQLLQNGATELVDRPGQPDGGGGGGGSSSFAPLDFDPVPPSLGNTIVQNSLLNALITNSDASTIAQTGGRPI